MTELTKNSFRKTSSVGVSLAYSAHIFPNKQQSFFGRVIYGSCLYVVLRFFFFFWSRQTPRQLGGVIWDFKIRARTFKVVVSVTPLSSTSPLKLALWEKYPNEEQQGIYFSWKRKSFNNGNQLILMLNSTHVFLSELRQILSCLDKNGNKIIISPVQGFPYFPIKNFLKINLLFSDFETCIENAEI